MPIDVHSAIRDLGTAVRARSLVPFCGAGVSLGASPRIPDAREFLRNFGQEGLSWQEGAAVLASQPVFWMRFQETFGDVGSSMRSPGEQHRLLACLDAPFYVTTNYDQLLERALQQIQTYESVGVLNGLRGLSNIFQYRNLVVKLHGDVQSQELLVFSKSDYLNRLRSPTIIDDFVRLLFATHTILFIGYSLDDQHIQAILQWEIEVTPQAPRRKYILVQDVDPKRAAELERLNVFPIVVGELGGSYEESVCDFLARLWEQHEHYGSFTRMIENSSRTARDRVRDAMLYRQTGQLQQARDCLDKLFREGDVRFDLEVLADFLWISVSVRDKCEDWAGLEAFDGTFVAQLFRRLGGQLPQVVLGAVRSAYKESLTIAYCRAGEFAKAVASATESVTWRCTDTASRGFQIVTGSTLVAAAMANLHLWAVSRDNALLNEAKTSLDNAWRILGRHGNPGQVDESHHLGRFYGMRAFLAIAMEQADLAGVNIDELLQDALRAHEPARSRTRFGRIAGRYCDAVCHYWLAGRLDDTPSREVYLRRARELASRAGQDLDPSQIAARLKVEILSAKLRAPGDGATEEHPKILDDLGADLPKALRQAKQRMGDESWILLPLN